MADEPKAKVEADEKRWDTTGYRVMPVEARGGDQFAMHVPKADADLDACLARVAGKHPAKTPEFVSYKAGEIVKSIPSIEVKGLLARGFIVKANGPGDPFRDRTPPKTPKPFEEVEP